MRREDFPYQAQRLRATLIQIAAHIVGDRDEAEDIVQDVLLKLWTLCQQLQPPIDALAKVVTRNLARDQLRRRHRTQAISDWDVGCDDEPPPDQHRLEHVLRCIDALPTLQQLVIRLRHIEGMDYRRIASLTGSTETAVRKVISRARQTIRDQYLEEER